jgi:SAM-dependent methyltransferase
MTSGFDWATQTGDVWTRRWRDTDVAMADLGVKLQTALLLAAPSGAFRALEIGCGAGSTSLQLARARPDATIIACDLSPALADLARKRLAGIDRVRVVVGDAEAIAGTEGPFDLIFSRHGVMFFADPVRAFQSFRSAAAPGASLVFSCFQDWNANPWASELSEAAAGRPLPPPGRVPSGFAFAEPDYVRHILEAAGWRDTEAWPTPFRYTPGEGEEAVDRALDFLAEIGPASKAMLALPEHERGAALSRMRQVIERYRVDNIVEFPAASWIWRARAD